MTFRKRERKNRQMVRNNKEEPSKIIQYIIEKLGWKKLSGWSRNYFANPIDGKIYSVSKTDGKLKELNSNPGSNGYRTVKLKGLDGEYHTKSEHKLILNAFVPNISDKIICHHINHDRTDNRLENLEWVSYKDNSRRRKDNDICK